MARKPKTQQLTIPDLVPMVEPIGRRGTRDVYKDNPFVAASQGFSVTVRKDMMLVGGDLEIKDKAGSDVVTGVIGKAQIVDTDEFVKLYTKNIGVLFDLSARGQKALIAVFCAVQQHKDQAHIYLPYHYATEFYEKLGIIKVPSRTTFSLGMSDLIKMKFLAAHYLGEGWYWVNPAFVFNGDRIRFVNEYRLRRRDQLPEV